MGWALPHPLLIKKLLHTGQSDGAIFPSELPSSWMTLVLCQVDKKHQGVCVDWDIGSRLFEKRYHALKLGSYWDPLRVKKCGTCLNLLSALEKILHLIKHTGLSSIPSTHRRKLRLVVHNCYLILPRGEMSRMCLYVTSYLMLHAGKREWQVSIFIYLTLNTIYQALGKY